MPRRETNGCLSKSDVMAFSPSFELDLATDRLSNGIELDHKCCGPNVFPWEMGMYAVLFQQHCARNPSPPRTPPDAQTTSWKQVASDGMAEIQIVTQGGAVG